MQNIRVNIEEVRSVNNNIESARSELIKMRNSLLQDLEHLSRYVLSSKVTDLIRTIQGKNADLTDGISVDISQCCSFLEARMNEYMVSA